MMYVVEMQLSFGWMAVETFETEQEAADYIALSAQPSRYRIVEA